MKYYIDITFLPVSEILLYFLWQKVYQQIHFALAGVEKKGKVNIGVAFPGYDSEKLHLGNKLRLFVVDKRNLKKLKLKSYLLD